MDLIKKIWKKLSVNENFSNSNQNELKDNDENETIETNTLNGSGSETKFKKSYIYELACPKCNELNTGYKWCQQCNAKRFQKDFPNWTSGNKYIDKFIQESQLNAQNEYEALEWIPYNRLTDIEFLAEGGFSIVYKATWLDGKVEEWDNEENKWIRIGSSEVAIKNPNNSSNINEFLNEWKIHFDCYVSTIKICNFIPLFGFTQDPVKSDYMIVMEYASNGNLRKYLNNIPHTYNWYIILKMLKNIISGLKSIHESNLIHCDLHDGNILCHDIPGEHVSDLGLCKPIDYFKNKANNEVYGNLPYIDPEVLRARPYTPASDIYSFAMIMWELTSRVPPFDDRAHDEKLVLDICNGERPEIIEGTPQCYVSLMKKCWDSNPLKRPKASEVESIISNWLDKKLEKDIEEFKKADEDFHQKSYNLSSVNTKSHPQAYHTSRLLDFTKKLNGILEQQEKGNNDTVLSENLDRFSIDNNN